MRATKRLACLGAVIALATTAPAMALQQAAPSPPTEAEQLRQWAVLAERGNAEALFNLGNAYRQGRGVPRDLDAAETLYARAARNNHVEAQGLYGLLLIQRGATVEGLDQVERAARRGDTRAQYVLGTALFYGDGLAADRPRALALMAQAAAGGFALAQTQLAEMQREMAAQAPAGEGVALAEAAPPAAPPVAPAPAPAAPAPPPSAMPMTALAPQSAVPGESSSVETGPAPAIAAAGTAPASVGSTALSPAARMPPGTPSTEAPTPAEIEMALAPQGMAAGRRIDPPSPEPAPLEPTPTEPTRVAVPAPAETGPAPAAAPPPATAPAPVPVQQAATEQAAETGAVEAPVETTAVAAVPDEPMAAPAPAPPVAEAAMAAATPSSPPLASAPPIEPAPAANLQIEPAAPAAGSPAPAPAPSAAPMPGHWRLQLGAFRVDGNARRAWQELQSLLQGLQPHYAQQGDLTLLQAGPLQDRGAARRACAVVRGAGHQCLPWGPPAP